MQLVRYGGAGIHRCRGAIDGLEGRRRPSQMVGQPNRENGLWRRRRTRTHQGLIATGVPAVSRVRLQALRIQASRLVLPQEVLYRVCTLFVAFSAPARAKKTQS